MVDPVVIRMKRGKAIFDGFLPSILALFGFSLVAFEVLGPGGSTRTAVTALCAGLLFAVIALFFFRIAYHQPVALRMDDRGISGHYVDPAGWEEIAKIGVFNQKNNTATHRNYRFVGFALHNPSAFRDRQSVWGRLKSWSSGRAYGYHILVAEAFLKDTDIDELAKRAHALRAAAVGEDDPNQLPASLEIRTADPVSGKTHNDVT